MFDGNIFQPTKWDGTTPFGVMGVSVLRVDGSGVVQPFYTEATARLSYVMLRRTLTVVKRSKKERSPRTVGNYGSTSGQLDLHRFVISWSS